MFKLLLILSSNGLCEKDYVGQKYVTESDLKKKKSNWEGIRENFSAKRSQLSQFCHYKKTLAMIKENIHFGNTGLEFGTEGPGLAFHKIKLKKVLIFVLSSDYCCYTQTTKLK